LGECDWRQARKMLFFVVKIEKNPNMRLLHNFVIKE
jgi:hypothetical protein